MNSQKKFEYFGRFGTDWRRLLFRGSIMHCIGVLLVAASLFKPDVMIMSAREFSWLPVAGIVVLTVGILEFFYAFIARELKDYFLNLQNGVFDVVVAGLIIFSIGDDCNWSLNRFSLFAIITGNQAVHERVRAAFIG